MDYDTLALELINEWENEDYNSEGQKKAVLQCVLVSAFKNQEKDIKSKCVDALKSCENVGTDKFPRVRLYEAIGACLEK